MRLFLAVAVLMLALIAYTEAQDTEPTYEERFSQFRDKVTEMGQSVAEGAKNFYVRVQNSDLATKARTAFDQFVEKLKGQ